QVPKYSVDRLRPHFIDVCQPIGFNCTFPHELVTNYSCSGSDEYNLRESRLSFFSGHAATAFYTSLFISIYLESRLRPRGFSSTILRSIHIVLLVISLWVSCTRITDNFHHPTDVLTGIFFGGFVAFLT
ncbi:hypothetical protein PMAYCL1PPCAC_29877, partial [Pristionchus mayeri]